MTVVVGTAGHIDHGKTTLLRALTGIDADRLPEEQRRGLTIDVGYAHGSPDGGPEIDFVDVPGHDRLVGNMLVGAGEIDACLLVVAADDGPRAQTWEHLGLLDAMGIEHGIVAITKADLVEPGRVEEVAARLRPTLDRSVLAGSPMVAVSATTGAGIEGPAPGPGAISVTRSPACRTAAGPKPAGWPSTASSASAGAASWSPGAPAADPSTMPQSCGSCRRDGRVRVRGIQVHGIDVATGPPGGRVALNLAGATGVELRRGSVLTTRLARP